MKKIMHVCPVCNVEFHGRRGRVYCSIACRATCQVPWNKGLIGIKGNRQKNGEFRNCKNCGKEFYKTKPLNYGIFCSYECYTKNRNETRYCLVCNNEFIANKSSTRKTCSKKCFDIRKSEIHRAEKSHLWRGGKVSPYINDWKFQRQKAIERDGKKCVLCGSVDRIQVHHINPYRYSKSHELDNLITLCRSCHSREEILVNKASYQGLMNRWKKIKAVEPEPRQS